MQNNAYLYVSKLSQRLNSIKFSWTNNHLRWMKWTSILKMNSIWYVSIPKLLLYTCPHNQSFGLAYYLGRVDFEPYPTLMTNMETVTENIYCLTAWWDRWSKRNSLHNSKFAKTVSHNNVYVSRPTRCTNSYNVSLFIIKCSTVSDCLVHHQEQHFGTVYRTCYELVCLAVV